MKKAILVFVSATCILAGAFFPTFAQTNEQSGSGDQLEGSGLMGYISAKASQPDSGYGAGVGFYVSVYPILPEPIDNFQIGLASTWIIPRNADDKDQPLCPPGSYARDNWPRRGPTYGSVFQTIEGGLGIWGSTQFRAGYKAPKFQIVGVPDCYTGNYLISPGWSNTTEAADENNMGIAQLSNRFIIPPDGFTFQSDPNGELFGYSWMALPLMDKKSGPPPTGDQHWTLFLALANFKGPVAFVIPESWSKISADYHFDYGRGLDAQEGLAGGGAQEFNTVPYFEVRDKKGITWSKVPNFIYPVDDKGRTDLLQDVRYYSDKALANSVLNWRHGGEASSGRFNTSGDASFLAPIAAAPISFRQGPENVPLKGIGEVVETTVFDSYTFGLQWHKSSISPNGDFPRYYMQTDSGRIAVAASKVPEELRNKKFKPAVNKNNYFSPDSGAWSSPGPVNGPCYALLADGSRITYYWYRFMDQPSLQQYKKTWTREMFEQLQDIVEKIQRNWTPDQEYMPAPHDGKPLISIDPGLLVTPPAGLEVGYVPIVVRQEAAH